MDYKPVKWEAVLMWYLLVSKDGIAWKELPAGIEKKHRDSLANAKLIEVEGPKRGPFHLRLTEQGWYWAGKHLDAELPSGKPTMFVLQQVLPRLKARIETGQFSLADFCEGIKPAESARAEDSPQPTVR